MTLDWNAYLLTLLETNIEWCFEIYFGAICEFNSKDLTLCVEKIFNKAIESDRLII
jgi:hypothetical protein